MVYVDTEQDSMFGKMNNKTVSELTQQKVDYEIRTLIDISQSMVHSQVMKRLPRNRTGVHLHSHFVAVMIRYPRANCQVNLWLFRGCYTVTHGKSQPQDGVLNFSRGKALALGLGGPRAIL
jgi:hypothetical protein